jgi:hypothetical protein
VTGSLILGKDLELELFNILVELGLIFSHERN